MTQDDAVAAATEAVQGGEDVAIDSHGAISAAMRLLSDRGRLTKAATTFSREIPRILAGRSNVELPSRDARFADPTWRENPFYRRWGQAYIASCAALEELVQESQADWRSRERQGIIDARSLALMFLWLRPNDLIWNYWVNNYLMGNDPPAFDILAWNADGTNLPAALHAQFLEMFGQNLLIKPAGIAVLGTVVDYRQVKCDLYVVGGLTDHLTPWRATYRTTQLFGGNATFVLSNTGHVQTVVCPPSRKAYHLAGPDPGTDPDAWLNAAERKEGHGGGIGRSGLRRARPLIARHPGGSAAGATLRATRRPGATSWSRSAEGRRSLPGDVTSFDVLRRVVPPMCPAGRARGIRHQDS